MKAAGRQIQASHHRSRLCRRRLLSLKRHTGPEALQPRASWTEPDFDDSPWSEGVTGVGFDVKETFDPFVRLDLETQMDRQNDSAYLHIFLEVTDPDDFAKLVLRMKI